MSKSDRTVYGSFPSLGRAVNAKYLISLEAYRQWAPYHDRISFCPRTETSIERKPLEVTESVGGRELSFIAYP